MSIQDIIDSRKILERNEVANASFWTDREGDIERLMEHYIEHHPDFASLKRVTENCRPEDLSTSETALRQQD